MILKKPTNGDTVFEYVPQNLNSGRWCYIEHKWRNISYFINRFNAGLIYTDFDALEFRISYEKKMYHQHEYYLKKYMSDLTPKDFQQQYMCEWKSDK